MKTTKAQDAVVSDTLATVAKLFQVFHIGVGDRLSELNDIVERDGELTKERLLLFVGDLIEGHRLVNEAVQEVARAGLSDAGLMDRPRDTLLN